MSGIIIQNFGNTESMKYTDTNSTTDIAMTDIALLLVGFSPLGSLATKFM